jgi:plasmid stabilization system protein ParE
MNLSPLPQTPMRRAIRMKKFLHRLGQNMDTMCKVEYIATFHVDVIKIADDLDEYPEKAARIFAKLDKILSNLILMPEMFPLYDDFSIFRKIVIEDYLVFYTYNNFTGLIEIHRLLYGGMDLPNYLM